MTRKSDILDVASMVVSWWIMAFLLSGGVRCLQQTIPREEWRE